MSIGIGGWAELFDEDSSVVVYQYAPYNLNKLAFRNSEKILDGLITINKRSLIEPQIREKIKRSPHGKKKKYVKRIIINPDLALLFESKDISVENSKFCWITLDNDCDVIAIRLIREIMISYQENGTLPKTVSVHV